MKVKAVCYFQEVFLQATATLLPLPFPLPSTDAMAGAPEAVLHCEETVGMKATHGAAGGLLTTETIAQPGVGPSSLECERKKTLNRAVATALLAMSVTHG